MNILLTGSSGFLGSHLLERLISLGFSVICLKRESSNLTRTRHFFEKATWLDIETTDTDQLFFNYQVDCIIHCATDYGRKKVDPIQTIEANLILPLKIDNRSDINADEVGSGPAPSPCITDLPIGLPSITIAFNTPLILAI